MKKHGPNMAALALFATAAFAAGTAAAADIKEVRFGVEASYAPFESKSPDGTIDRLAAKYFDVKVVLK